MGRLHAALQQWNQAAYHLKIALEMKFSPLHGRLTLGFIYLEQQAYNEAESEFRTLVTEARRTLVRLRSAAAAAGADAKTVKDALLGTCTSGNPGDEMPINELLLRNNLLLARVFTERGLDDARASRLIRHARRRLKHTSGDTRRELEARCSDYQGWADRAVGRLDDALRHLEASIRIYADAESYYHLTTTCLDLAEAQAQAPLRKKWVARAEWHHKQLTAVDVEREFARGAEEIEARLAALRKELAKSDKKTDGDGAAKPEPKTEPTAEPETG